MYVWPVVWQSGQPVTDLVGNPLNLTGLRLIMAVIQKFGRY